MADKKRKYDWTDDDDEVNIVFLANTLPSCSETELRKTLESMGNNPIFALRLLRAKGHIPIIPSFKRTSTITPTDPALTIATRPVVRLPPTPDPAPIVRRPVSPRPVANVAPRPTMSIPPRPAVPIPPHTTVTLSSHSAVTVAPRSTVIDVPRPAPTVRMPKSQKQLEEQWRLFGAAQQARLPAEYVAAVNEGRLANVYGFPTKASPAEVENSLAGFLGACKGYMVWWPFDVSQFGIRKHRGFCQISVTNTAELAAVSNALHVVKIERLDSRRCLGVKIHPAPQALVCRLGELGCEVQYNNSVKVKTEENI